MSIPQGPYDANCCGGPLGLKARASGMSQQGYAGGAVVVGALSLASQRRSDCSDDRTDEEATRSVYGLSD